MEIGLDQTIFHLTKLLFQTTILQRLTKICRRPFTTVCLLLKVAGLVEACMLSISTSCAVFSIRSHNPNLVLQRRCVLLYYSFHEFFFRFLVTSSEYPERPEGYSYFRIGVATSLEPIRYSEEGRLAGYFMWGVAMIFSLI